MRTRTHWPSRHVARLAFALTAILGTAGLLCVVPAASAQTVLPSGPAPAVLAGKATLIGPHAAGAALSLNLGLPLRDPQGLAQFIADEIPQHHYLTPAQFMDRFAPDPSVVQAAEAWVRGQGMQLGYVSPDGLSVTANATTGQVESALHVQVNDYTAAGDQFYSVAQAPTVPAGLSLQSITGLNDEAHAHLTTSGPPPGLGTSGAAVPATLGTSPAYYYPSALRTIYGVGPDGNGHTYDGSGQTIGITLWGKEVAQADLTAFHTKSGDPAITVDSSVSCSGGSCAVSKPADDHVVFVHVDGSSTTDVTGELGMDVEYAHGMALHSGLKVFLGGGGSATALEDAISAATNDPDVQIISNSWLWDQPYCSLTDLACTSLNPFVTQTTNSFMEAASLGKTFYFASADFGTSPAGSGNTIGTSTYPASSPYVVAVGGTSLYDTTATTYSTEVVWSGTLSLWGGSLTTGWAGGSGCSVFARPAWQAGVAAATCPGRAIPDISADADPYTGVIVQCDICSASQKSGSRTGNGGTSLATPLVAGMAAVTQNYMNAQTYPPATNTSMGFAAPTIYALGNDSANDDTYFHDVTCGNNTWPIDGITGDSAVTGWDGVTGWGSPRWLGYSEGFARAAGATNVTVPSPTNPTYPWNCTRSTGDASVNGISCPTATTCYAVGDVAASTNFTSTAGPGTIEKSVDGGADWTPLVADMSAIACPTSTTCIAVGDGGMLRVTANAADSSPTWTTIASGTHSPLTAIACADATHCDVVGNGGTLVTTADGGATWAAQNPGDDVALTSIACPGATECLATTVDGHVLATTDGNTWTMIATGAAVLHGIVCTSTTACVAVGATSTNTGAVYTTSNATAGDSATWTNSTIPSSPALTGVACPATSAVTCVAVGGADALVEAAGGSTWSLINAHGATLNSVACTTVTDTAACWAVGSLGSIVTASGALTTWTTETSSISTALYGIGCAQASSCFALGQQGVLLTTTDAGSTWTRTLGGGVTDTLHAISCTNATTCFAAGDDDTVLVTRNGGITWTRAAQFGANTNDVITAISCVSSGCAVAGYNHATSPTVPLIKYSADGSTWSTGSAPSAALPTGVSCVPTTPMVCVMSSSDGEVYVSSNAGATWSASLASSGPVLNAVSCPLAASPTAVTCYVAGASGTILKTTDAGTTWTDVSWAPTTYGTTIPDLHGIACTSVGCIADGATGALLQSTDGATWVQEFNPLSGPSDALNANFDPSLGSWTIEPSLLSVACTTPTVCVTGGERGIVLQGTISTVPTAAYVAHFTATRVSGGIVARWRLAARAGVTSFSLFAGAHHLTTVPVHVHTADAYRLRIRTSRQGPYRLYVHLTSGRTVLGGTSRG